MEDVPRASEKGTVRNTDVANLPPPVDTGKTRDIVAEKVGFKSGREAERAIL